MLVRPRDHQCAVVDSARRFRIDHPEVNVSVDHCAPGQFVQKIESGQVDFGVGTLDGRVSSLEERVFVRDYLSVIADRSVRFPQATRIIWRQLALHPLITVKPGYSVRGSIDRGAAEAGVTLQIAHEVTLLSIALVMAAAGLGVSAAPGPIHAHAAYPDLVARRLSRPTVARNIAVITQAGRTLSPSAAAFADLLAREVGS